MVYRRPQKTLKGLMAALLSLSVLLSVSSCMSIMEEMLDIYNSVEADESTGDTDLPIETYESLPPTGTYTSSTAETTEPVYSFVKESCVYSVWYDVSTDNPADYDWIASEKAYALKGVFYFSSPLRTVFEARLLKGDEVILTRNVNMYDNVTAEADFSAGLEGLGTFEPGDYTVELYLDGELVAKTDIMRVK